MNWVDLAILGIVIYYLLTSKGFLSSALELVTFVAALMFSYKCYAFFGHLVIAWFNAPRGISNAIGFFVAWFLVELILYGMVAFMEYKYLSGISNHPLNRIFGYPAAFLQAIILTVFLVSLIFAFPVRGQIKQDILDSKTGPYFVNASQSFEKSLKSVFGDAISETLNFLTVKPESNASLGLGFKLTADKMSPDESSEHIMLDLVNKERRQRGLSELQFDPELQRVARKYAEEMLQHGFFSHVSQVDGSTPGDRATRDNVDFLVLGENLAYAPDVYQAHQGLMNSEGHRANILSGDYGKAGIGVIDAGVYGRMFVQEFRN